MFAACSADRIAAHPFPDLDGCAAVADPDRRLRSSLSELYVFYRAGAPMLENPPRDARASEG